MNYDKFYYKAKKLIENANEHDKFVNRIDQGPYREAGFVALQNFSMQAGKTLFLANGGAAVALLTLLGANIQSEDPIIIISSLWFIIPMAIFGIGIISSFLLYAFAMKSQKYFNEPIPISKNYQDIKRVAKALRNGKLYQNLSMKSGIGSVIMFLLGIISWIIILA